MAIEQKTVEYMYMYNRNLSEYTSSINDKTVFMMNIHGVECKCGVDYNVE